MAKIKSYKREITLKYYDGKDHPEKGPFRKNIVIPEYSDELFVWIEETLYEYFEEDGEITNSYVFDEINICGTKRSLYELGKYFITLSEFETKNIHYYDIIDELKSHQDYKKCALKIHHPIRLKHRFEFLELSDSEEENE